MLNKRSKYFLSLVFRVKKKRRRSRLTPEPGMRRAWLMKWDYTHRLSLSSSRPPCVSGAMKTAPEMLSMLISRGDDRRGWMFSSCTFIGWLGWCLSERQALRLAAKFGLIQKHGSRRCRRHSFQWPRREKNVKLNAPTDSLLIRHSGVFSRRRQLYLKVTQLPERRAS